MGRNAEWLQETKKTLTDNHINTISCHYQNTEYENLMIFELDGRTCFIWIEKQLDKRFLYGDVEKGENGLSLGVFSSYVCSPLGVARAIQNQLKWNQEEREEYGQLIVGEIVPMEEIRQSWLYHTPDGRSFLKD